MKDKKIDNRQQTTDNRKSSGDSKKKSFFGKNSDGKKNKPPYAKASEGEKDELKEMEHSYKRALADYQNLIKRTDVEKQDFMKYANERLLTEILPVYDNLKLALAHANGNEGDSIVEGVKHVLNQFKSVLNNLGVEEIKTIGEKFDHHTMEAVEKKETDDKKKDGIVESEVMAGYRLGDKVIRAARVVVYEYKK